MHKFILVLLASLVITTGDTNAAIGEDPIFEPAPSVPDIPPNFYVQSSSSDGLFSVRWGSVSGYRIRYELYEEYTKVYDGSHLSIGLSKSASGTYRYRVRACDNRGCGRFTSFKSVNVDLEPSSPTNVSASAELDSVSISWNSGRNASYYKLYRKNLAQHEYEFVSQVVGTSFSINSHPEGNYRYRVSGCNESSCDSLSQESNAIQVYSNFVPVPDAGVIHLPTPENDYVGSLNGTAGVDGYKSTYSIEIPVPPGRNNLSPGLTLSYSSGTGVSTTGFGWSLSYGGSSISRCAQIKDANGQNKPVQYEVSDNLCLGGEILKVIEGSHGESGAVYKTEIDTFSRVSQMDGSTNSLISHFVVELKSGLIEEYGGYGANHLTAGRSRSVPDSWLLKKVKDRIGNEIEYEYIVDNGEAIISRIYYTGFNGVRGNREIIFHYSNKNSISESFRNSKLVKSSKKLDKLEFRVDNESFGFLKLDYQDSSISDRALLSSVQWCKRSTCSTDEKYPATSFQYYESDEMFSSPNRQDIIPENFDTSRVDVVADIDGDGTRDKIFTSYGAIIPGQQPNNTPVAKRLLLSTGAELNILSEWNNVFSDEEPYISTKFFPDFDLDGKSDLLGMNSNRLYVGKFSTEAQRIFTVPTNIRLNITSGEEVRYIDDFNNDGRPDLVISRGGAYTIYLNCSSTESEVDFCEQFDLPEMPRDNDRYGNVRDLGIVSVKDLDGNGIPDFILGWTSTVDQSTDYQTRIWFGSYTPDRQQLVYVESILENIGGPQRIDKPMRSSYWLDINGDGLEDYLVFSPDYDHVYINNGGQFSKEMIEYPIDVDHEVESAVLVIDSDGDGVDELLLPIKSELVTNYCKEYWEYSETVPGSGSYDLTIINRCAAEVPSKNSIGFTNRYASDNRAFYKYQLAKFEKTSEGILKAKYKQTDLVLPLHMASVDDVNGDGAFDIIFRTKREFTGVSHNDIVYTPISEYLGGLYTTVGLYYVENKQFGLDLLTEVTDGLGKKNQFKYSPLSGLGSSSCQYGDELPFYQLDTSLASPEHFHFSSSLPVVSESLRSNNIGTMNSTCYAYENAMFSANGRGFQGFQTIHTYDNINDGLDKKHTTTYHDYFPLTGIPKETWVRNKDTQKLISRKKTVYGCEDEPRVDRNQSNYASYCEDTSNDGVYFVYKSSEHDFSYELENNHRLSNVVEHKYSYDSFGNLTQQVNEEKVYNDGLLHSIYRDINSHVYDYSDASDWWIDKLVSSKTTYQPVIYRNSDVNLSELNSSKKMQKEYEYNNRDERQVIREILNSFSSSTKIAATYGYDQYGNITHRTQEGVSGETREWIMEYSESYDGYFKTKEINPLGQSQTFEYTKLLGKVSSHTDLNGVMTTNTYDSLGRLINISKSGSPTISYSRKFCDSMCYSGANYYLVKTEDGQPTEISYYDILDKVIRNEIETINDPKVVTLTQYDARGHKVAESSPFFENEDAQFTFYFEFDDKDRYRMKIVNRGELVTQQWEYKYEGNTTRITLPGGSLSAERTIGKDGKLIETIDELGSRTRFFYDGMGNQLAIIDTNGNQVRFNYDSSGRHTSTDDPNAGVYMVTRNSFGDIISEQDANGNVLEFDYDKLGRRTFKVLNGINTARWTYDESHIGSVSSIESLVSDYNESYQYDELGNLTQKTVHIDGQRFESRYAYDSYYNRLKGKVLPSNEIVQYEYDSNGRLLTISNPVSQFEYYSILERDAYNKVTTEIFGNGTQGLYDYYSGTNFIKSSVTRSEFGRILQGFEYNYDDDYGNLTSRRNTKYNVSEEFEYDDLQRVIASRIGNQAKHYQFDDIGNLIHKSDFAQVYSYGNSARSASNAGPHAVVSTTSGDKVSYFQYDLNGNMTSGNGKTITYNEFNKPTRISEGDKVTKFFYSPLGQLVKKLENGQITYTLSDEFESVVNAQDQQVSSRSYISKSVVAIHEASSRKVNYLHSDRLNSVTLITGESHQTPEIREFGYDVFGLPTNPDWSDGNGRLFSIDDSAASITDRGFTNHQHLDDFRLINMGGRFYDPALGRFYSVDPYITDKANSQSMNAYSYVMNNPLTNIDPSGYKSCSVFFCVDKAVEKVSEGVNKAGEIAKKAMVNSKPSSKQFNAQHKEKNGKVNSKDELKAKVVTGAKFRSSSHSTKPSGRDLGVKGELLLGKEEIGKWDTGKVEVTGLTGVLELKESGPNVALDVLTFKAESHYISGDPDTGTSFVVLRGAQVNAKQGVSVGTLTIGGKGSTGSVNVEVSGTIQAWPPKAEVNVSGSSGRITDLFIGDNLAEGIHKMKVQELKQREKGTWLGTGSHKL